MQTINIYELGISYLGEVMSVFMESCAYFAVYLLGLIYILLKGDKRDKEIFLPSSVLLFLTVYNPIVAYLVNRFFDINSEYYRLFWIAPVIVLTGYIATTLIDGTKNTGEKRTIIVLLLLVGLFSGSFVYADGYNMADNIYQMPAELIEISEIIHNDNSAEYPKAFLEYEYNMQMRQYDPKMQLTIDREDYLRAMAESYSQEMIADAEHPQYCLLAGLMRGQKVSSERLLECLEATKTEYVVLTKGSLVADFVAESGLDKIAETEGHVIFRYDVREPYIFELVDYSDVEHKFSYRRLK